MLEGYLVMYATSRVTDIPFTFQSSLHEHSYQHLAGRYSGVSVCRASTKDELYLPQRSRSFIVLQDADVDFVSRAATLLAEAEGSEQVGFEKKLRDIASSKEDPPTRYACLLEAHGAGSYLAFLARHHSLYFWGAFNNNANILCWSTDPEFGRSLYPSWWVLPLETLTDDVKVVHVYRSVQRWMRWKNSGLDPAQRFLSLANKS